MRFGSTVLSIVRRFPLAMVLVVMTLSIQAFGAGPGEVRSAYYRGDYESCIKLAKAEVDSGIWNDFWAQQLIQVYLDVGKYEEASDIYEEVVGKFPTNLRLRLMAVEAYRFSGKALRGQELLDEIPFLVQGQRYRFRNTDNLLAIGKYSLNAGDDARVVLSFYESILKQEPDYVDAHLAIGELALEKSDFQEASKSLAKAMELRPEDPQVHYLLAKAWRPSDNKRAGQYLEAALGINARHVPSLLMQAENLISGERYAAASGVLERVLETNAAHPDAWALKGAIAHLEGKYSEEAECRKKGLEKWETNPALDFGIGRILSQHYRFTESVKYQRRALRLDPSFRPAKFQLAQDLLRLGETDEGWMLVDQVAEQDKYNVVAFNLHALQDRLDSFSTLRAEGIVVRMDAREAEIYGSRVLDLLLEAKKVLGKKYDMQIKEPITVEIFPQQSDFAIRTFGLPGGAGFLGVCFGSLITANSPASQGDQPANWESVLWHEFCHVVTLQKTNNRMPRWLSEGISVYEELERDPAWGQRMNPMYRKMMLGEDFVPLSELSGAFLNPKTPMHLQFAYFESSVAIGYLIETHGLPRMRRLLVDLGVGVPAQEAFAQLYGDAAVLDAEFEEYAQSLARSFAAEVDFASEGIPENAGVDVLKVWLEENPTNYLGHQQLIAALMRDEQTDQALEKAKALVELFPDDFQPGGGWELLAAAARVAGDVELERETLETLVGATSDNLTALGRLIEIYREQEAWPQVQQFAEKFVAVQPMVATGHEALRDAIVHQGDLAATIAPLNSLAQMSPADPALLHYELALANQASGELAVARREILMALEYSPRYRKAQQLLVAIRRQIDEPESEPASDAGLVEGDQHDTEASRWELRRPDDGLGPVPEPEDALLEGVK